MPAWFPAAAALSFTIAMTVIGVSWLNHGGTARVIGFAGTALILVHLALWPVLVLRWRRAGIVPRTDGFISAERRRRSYWITAAGFVICAVSWGITGRPGWAAITAGVLFGAESWYRLNGWRRR